MFKRIQANAQSIAQRKLICGIATNDADYLTKIKLDNGDHVSCPIYSRWMSMIHRCYSKKALLHRPTYCDCYVCEEWLTFSNFKAWMENQDWRGKHLDKDLLSKGNREYSPDKCLFIPRDVNALILRPVRRSNGLPLGVFIHSINRNYIAKINIDGKRKHLGSFSTPDLAFARYKEYKEAIIRSMADKHDGKIRDALLNYEVTP